MTILELKWIAASLILIISLSAGFALFSLNRRSRNWMQLGDSFANGVFIGAAVFHMLPHALDDIASIAPDNVYLKVFGIVITTIILLGLLDRLISLANTQKSLTLSACLIVVTLTIHAFIAGATLGLADTFAVIWILLTAICAHKAFEMMALVISLQRRLQSSQLVLLIFILFAFVTPIGIWMGTFFETQVAPYVDHLVSAAFSAVAAGTFLYIGLFHHNRLDNVKHDSHKQYTYIVSTIFGIFLMGIVGIWI